MTPKEKALELLYKFYPNVQWKLGQEDCLDRAKRCALIAVDLILDETIYYFNDDDIFIEYWQEIKNEINKL